MASTTVTKNLTVNASTYKISYNLSAKTSSRYYRVDAYVNGSLRQGTGTSVNLGDVEQGSTVTIKLYNTNSDYIIGYMKIGGWIVINTSSNTTISSTGITSNVDNNYEFSFTMPSGNVSVETWQYDDYQS